MSDIRQTHAPAVEPEPIYTAGEITDPAFYREPALPLAPTPPEPDTARLRRGEAK